MDENNDVEKKFIEDDDGAVTVDWVVLTAAMLVISSTVLGIIVLNTDSGVHAVSRYIGGVNVTAGNKP